MADADTRLVLSFHITYHCNYVIHTKLVTDMARPGVSKAEVQRARLGIMKAGKHPSIDAIRIELGNTGSKATIYRHLKEIEADEGGFRPSSSTWRRGLNTKVGSASRRSRQVTPLTSNAPPRRWSDHRRRLAARA